MCGLISVCGNQMSLTACQKAAECLQVRGPDASKWITLPDGIMGFHRLAIMGQNEQGMQPFCAFDNACICNGEIYNFQELARQELKDYSFTSGSDCEVLLPLWEKYETDMFAKLDGEFAMVLYLSAHQEWIAARDPLGIRPLFYGYQTANQRIAFASEMKALQPFCYDIRPFPIGSYYRNGVFHRYHDCAALTHNLYGGEVATLAKGIRNRLEAAVVKRLNSDAPVGFLLSGGLDSSLVCAIAAKHIKTPIRTFAIGMEEDAIDLAYAREAAHFIGSQHTEFFMNREMVMQTLPEVIYHLESYDITTIRASLAMYLLCKNIRENTDIKVLLSGEVSDELFGYKYTDYAPSPQAFQQESQKRIRELYQYDVLRADRCISAHGMEARVPFSDKELIDYVMHIDPQYKINRYGIGKYLLRAAFDDKDLPASIRMREKAAFSDAVGHSLADDLKAYAQLQYTDEEFLQRRERYCDHAKPFTKESLLYREIFESFYPGQAALIPGFWMPNPTWPNCNVDDPSARVLKNYGASGS